MVRESPHPPLKSLIMEALVNGAPEVLDSLDEETGRFVVDGGWGITSQDVIYPLALLYKTEDPANPYRGDERFKEAALLGGDCIRRFQYEDGRVEFLKSDGSRWGATYMPWTMYHWLETYILLRDEMDEERRRDWCEGLTLALNGMKREIKKAHVHNITTWKGMTLYRAGRFFNRRDLMDVGRSMVRRAVEAQDKAGFWPEHGGPTTHYNLVYIHSLGLYYEFSGDERVLESLRRALEFQIAFTYPDGALVETVDGRVKYGPSVSTSAIAAFTLFPKGRRYARFLLTRMKERGQLRCCTASLATAYRYVHTGSEEEIPQDRRFYKVSPLNGKALVKREGSWFYCLSAFLTKPTPNRWGMDRQNYLSLWHEASGLIIGGGNSKNQPGWSNFVVHDHGRTLHMADAARISSGKDVDMLDLLYGQVHCKISVYTVSDGEALIEYSTASVREPERPIQYNLTLHMVPGETIKASSGLERRLDEEEVIIPKVSGWVAHKNWRVEFDREVSLKWPVRPFNPYHKRGIAPLSMAACTLSGVLRGEESQRFRILVED